MKAILKRFFKVCPKTGKINGVKSLNGWSRLLFPIVGLMALIWILIRVIPKPSRVTYPCMRVAMPIASGFIAYLIGIIVSATAFMKAKKLFAKSRYIMATGFVIMGVLASFLIFHNSSETAYASYSTIVHEANLPMGVAQGIFPGRVVWVHNPDATNENCVPDSTVWWGNYLTYRSGLAWFLPQNNDQAVVDSMVSLAIQSLTGETSDSLAWVAIFKYHNTNRGKGAVHYSPGEKIFIKMNATSGWSGNYSTTDLSCTRNSYYGVSETSPAVVMSVFRQLVNVVGVEESDIYIGDPMKHIYKHLYDYWHSEFPDVHYLDHDNPDSLGREHAQAGTIEKIFYSDHGEILRENVWDADRTGEGPVYDDCLYNIFEDAEYMINIPMLKGHKRGGVTMFAKNHFGSHTRPDAAHLHNGLVAPREMEIAIERPGYGLYRVQVDIMSHSILGEKNLVYLMDALWATDHELGKPLKWQMAPFNDDFMSSVFVSLDPVAIESVGYDFLRSEFTAERVPAAGTYVQMDGVDDYLHQAADSSNWPEDLVYDSDNDGILFASLGVHEHWNNAASKQYSRNLDPDNGTGIELISIPPTTPVAIHGEPSQIAGSFKLYSNYPNPFNATTNIRYILKAPARVELKVYNLSGQLVSVLENSELNAGEHVAVWNGTLLSGQSAPTGVYIYQLNVATAKQLAVESRKMLLVK
ncbi:MAG: DUF362 domain-containing protein [Candidatus Marinimicrobia bacterium]|jgi:hypothetical protein|nr:DUF362 domain-containing protein [Candidatus Neomarinimicrobiota bacterium]MDD5061640.1 DUF362 domain-containing protein [Candidatus Neomarinimicrobiota bacterium]MDD5539755.1 DUF362 domain-containing protein [Candidatus Neomarinimicrobiota bacterium]